MVMGNPARPEQQAAMLRGITERMGLPPIRTLCKEPDVLGVYRITVDYYDRRAHDSCATLVIRRSGAQLAMHYQRAFDQKPILYPIATIQLEAFSHALQTLKFDTLSDQPEIPLYGLDFWMVERAAGTFVHSVIISPQTAPGRHADLVRAIQTHLPEALRLIV
ncbi:MAG: hypothetical protein K8J31_03490 [Anaerolineae bacterium]|nr:hypothetical protein [Anaerolineae bacterium]